ncbi:MAG: hypothetical protein GY859_12965 [Desulfobacterales bacterium]|nr:hypothetical protein [Desulfobacterales bacterium]
MRTPMRRERPRGALSGSFVRVFIAAAVACMLLWAPALAQRKPARQTPPGGMTCSRLIGTGIDAMAEGRLEEAREIFSEAAGSHRCSVIGRQVAQTHEQYAIFFLQEDMGPLDRIKDILLKTGTDNISRRAMGAYRNLFLEHEFKNLPSGPWLEVKEFLFKKNFGLLRLRGEGLDPEVEKRLKGLTRTFQDLQRAEEHLNPPGMTLARLEKINAFLGKASRRMETLLPSDTSTAELERSRISDLILPFEEAVKKYNGLVDPFKTDPERWAEVHQNMVREQSDWMDNLPEELRQEYADLLAGFEKIQIAEGETDPFLKLEHYRNARPEAAREATQSAFVHRKINELQARIDAAEKMYEKLLSALAAEDEPKARNVLNGLGDALVTHLGEREPQNIHDIKSIFKDIDEGDGRMKTPDASDHQLQEAMGFYESAKSKSTSLEDASGEIAIVWLPEQRLLKRRRLAIFPWRISVDVNIYTPVVLDAIVDFFNHNKKSAFFIKSSFYHIETPGGEPPIDAIVIDENDLDPLWESLSNVENNPNLERIIELGRELNVDAVLMVDFRMKEKGVFADAEVLRLYLIDIETNTLYYAKNRSKIAAYMGDLKTELVVLLKELMRPYSSPSM